MRVEGMRMEDVTVEDVRVEGMRVEGVRMEDVRMCIPPYLTPSPAHLCGGMCCQEFFLHINHLVSNDHPPLGFLL